MERDLLLELIDVAKRYMDILHFPVRKGYLNDICVLGYGYAEQLQGECAKFKVHDAHEDITNGNDRIEASYHNVMIYVSPTIYNILSAANHPRTLYAKSIFVHECVHYLQPFDGEQITPGNLDIEQTLELPYEFDAYLIQSLYYFGQTQVPLARHLRRALIDQFRSWPK